MNSAADQEFDTQPAITARAARNRNQRAATGKMAEFGFRHRAGATGGRISDAPDALRVNSRQEQLPLARRRRHPLWPEHPMEDAVTGDEAFDQSDPRRPP
ncbi:hypothetical protein QC281_35560 [Streptomyces sp. DH17]|nr:hypothetical protein [Streptomyces sp. DH17]